MPSSEMSSSEIRSQRGAEGSWQQTPPEQVSPAEYIVQIDDGFWKRYSSHYEFPLALLLAVGLHVLAFLLVLAFMSLSYYFGNANCTLPVWQTFVPADSGPGTHPHERSGGGGGERSPFGPLSELDTIKPDIDEVRPPDLLIPNKDKRFEKEATTNPGKGGRGTDGGLGDGHGPGHGNKFGPNRGGLPWGRDDRWRLRLTYEDPELFVEQLSNLQVVIALRMKSGRFLVFRKIPARGPFEYQEMTEDQFSAFASTLDRLGFVTKDRLTTDNFAMGVNLAGSPHAMAIYIPKELEQAILNAELKYHNLPEKKIRERRLATHFDVVRQGGQWVIKITKSVEEKNTLNNTGEPGT